MSSPSSPTRSRVLNREDAGGVDESTSLLTRQPQHNYTRPSSPYARRPGLGRQGSHAHSARGMRRVPSQISTFTTKMASALRMTASRPASAKIRENLDDSVLLEEIQDRLWYDQFTTIDWVRDNIRDSERQKSLRNLSGLRGRFIAASHAAESWMLAAFIGASTAGMAYLVAVSERWFFDIKFGYCSTSWSSDQNTCCAGLDSCPQWLTWGQLLSSGAAAESYSFFAYVLMMLVLSILSCLLAMTVRLHVPLHLSSMKMDDDLALSAMLVRNAVESPPVPAPAFTYPATGSGVAEVRVILSGFVLHGYLGLQTLIVKSLSLVLSVASGLALGKEGPFVHIATAIANVASRISMKYRVNDGKRREMLSAGASAGIAVAFGAPISGVLFSLEEVSYYFPSKTLFRTFFSSIIAAVTLKVLNPYGTSKIVLFQVHYTKDWHAFEMFFFILLGVLGGVLGAFFIKSARWWARNFRGLTFIKRHPVLEVGFVAILTGITTFWNPYTTKPVTELMFELSSECMSFDETSTGLCPDVKAMLPEIRQLLLAFCFKAILTTITFGLKLPAGIYIPSMVLGGFLGRIIGHMVQYAIMNLASSSSTLLGTCAVTGNPEDCVVPGVYAMVAAAAIMVGITRLTVTIAGIMFELTGSLDHVLPFSVAVLAAKWTADALEPLSIYDLLTETNNYPFLDAKQRPLGLTGELGDITQRLTHLRIIDISHGPTVRVSVLREKLSFLAEMGELDGGMPIVCDNILVGLIATQDMEYALDQLARQRKVHSAESLDESIVEEDPYCLLAVREAWPNGRNLAADELIGDETDLTPFIDPSPIALDIHSSMELVYEVFQKLGLRYICVSREGLHAGLVHKKAFVHWVRAHKD